MVWWISRFSGKKKKKRRGQRQCPRVSGKGPGGALLTVSLRLSMADEDDKARLCHDAVSFLL